MQNCFNARQQIPDGRGLFGQCRHVWLDRGFPLLLPDWLRRRRRVSSAPRGKHAHIARLTLAVLGIQQDQPVEGQVRGDGLKASDDKCLETQIGEPLHVCFSESSNPVSAPIWCPRQWLVW